jgi:hypothetical protein
MESSSDYYAEKAETKKGYWINELQSLGISAKRINNYINNNNTDELSSSIKQLADLAENIKQTLYQEYKTAYSERMIELEEEFAISA